MDKWHEPVLESGTAYNATLFFNESYKMFDVYFGIYNLFIIKQMASFFENYLWFLSEINYKCFISIFKENLPIDEVLDSCILNINPVSVDNVLHDLKLLIKLFIFLKKRCSSLNEIYKLCDKNLDLFLKEIKELELRIEILKKEYAFIYFDHLNISYLKQMMELYFEKEYFCIFDYVLLPIQIDGSE
jgi:hypothetical protein